MASFALILPMYNEERIIADTLRSVDSFLRTAFPQEQYVIIAVDNASTDKTGEVVGALIDSVRNLKYLRLSEKGKGLAIKAGWEYAAQESFDVFVFMDADLATDLSALPKMIEQSAACDICIGDRYHQESQTIRSIKRKFFSRAYRNLAQLVLNSQISDFPCGFKAVNRSILQEIVPLVENTTWFFDSELVCLAEKAGKKIIHVPVQWEDKRNGDQESKVNVWQVSRQYFSELIRLRKKITKMK